MLRRTILRCDLHTTHSHSPSWRAPPMQNLMGAVVQSPYKDSFKEYWSTPVPWAKRDYGPKPKIGDPIPLRDATTMLVAAKNNHIDPARVATGEDNDYKILMLFREPVGRYHKDQFVLPSAPVTLADRDEDWGPLLLRLGVTTPHSDMSTRLAALRALLVECNLVLLPNEGGGLAEVQGPPGGRNWHMMIMSQPALMRQFVDILELPLEGILQRLLPFIRVQTPNTEQFRFDSTAYIATFHKVPCVKYTVSVVGEQLFWVSPKEALARYEAGVMELPTPTIVMFNELNKHMPRFDDINRKLTMDTEPRVVTPELVHDPVTRMATVLLPGDIHHTETKKIREQYRKKMLEKKQTKKKQQAEAAAAAAHGGSSSSSEGKSALKQDASSSSSSEDNNLPDELPNLFYRIQYEKDEPYGVRSVLCHRPVTVGDDTTPMPAVAEKLIEADAPQLQTLESMRQDEEQYAHRAASRQHNDAKMMQKMMSSPEQEGEKQQQQLLQRK